MECINPKCFNCQLIAEYKICVKGHKCDSCKVSKEYTKSITCFKNRKCDACVLWEECYQYVTKKYCINFTGKKEKCIDYKDLLPKCINNGNYSSFIIKYFTNLLS